MTLFTSFRTKLALSSLTCGDYRPAPGAGQRRKIPVEMGRKGGLGENEDDWRYDFNWPAKIWRGNKMATNSSDLRGVVHGKTIELEQEPGLPDG